MGMRIMRLPEDETEIEENSEGRKSEAIEQKKACEAKVEQE